MAEKEFFHIVFTSALKKFFIDVYKNLDQLTVKQKIFTCFFFI